MYRNMHIKPYQKKLVIRWGRYSKYETETESSANREIERGKYFQE
jgi:hypothetical protein